MKYAMLVYSDQTAWAAMTEDEAAAAREESMPRWIALFEEFGNADPNVQGRELVSAAEAKVVRVVDGATVVTDGPFAETKEELGGFYLFDCKDLDEAIELAARIPGAQQGTIEVRPILELGDDYLEASGRAAAETAAAG